MATFSISTDIICTIEVDGKSRLSDDFHARMLECVKKSISKSEGYVTLTKVIEKTPSQMKIGVHCSSGTKGYNEFANRVSAGLKSMTEYGRDSDIMQVILVKYPHLKDHPRINELVGNFDMMSDKIKELDSDTKSKPTQATPPLAKPGKDKPKSKKEIRELREEQLKGQAPGQLQSTAKGPGGDLKHLITPAAPIQRGTVNVFDPGGNGGK